MPGRDSLRWGMSDLSDYASGCESCGAQAETRYVDFHQHIGLVVLMLHSSVKGELCRECVGQNFWTTTGITLVAGWWGCVSFFITPFVLLNNVVRYLSCMGMGTDPGRSPDPPRRRQRPSDHPDGW